MEMVCVKCFVLLMVLLAHSTGASPCDKKSCQRVPLEYPYGYDYTGLQPIIRDYGKCENVPSADDIGSGDGFPLVNGSIGSAPCQCLPAAYVHSTLFVRLGPSPLMTIAACEATGHSVCERKPSHHTFHAHSAYAIELDLGHCMGECEGEEGKCVPLSEKSVAIEGPNGYSTASNVTECGCAWGKCHRQNYYQQFRSTEHFQHGNETLHRTVEKVINVGRCIGQCDGIFFETCLPGPFPYNCVLYGRPRQAVCVPHETTSHSLLVGGVEKKVVSVVTCQCARR